MSQTTSKTQEIAEALADELAAIGLPAQRVYLLRLEPENLQELKISVVAKGETREVLDRTGNLEDHSVDIAVQQKVDPADVEAVDGLVLVVERIKNLWSDPEADGIATQNAGDLRDKELAGADWQSLTNDPIYYPDRLADKQEFASVVTVTYRLRR